MNPIEETFRELEQAGARLNDNTEHLNSLIDQYEQRLNAIKLGVSEEVEIPETYEYLPVTHGFDSGPVAAYHAWQLRYAKSDDAWRLLAVHQVCPVERWIDGGNDVEPIDEDDREWQDNNVMPLRDAPRLLRIKAVGVFEELLGILKSKTERYDKTISEAKAKK